MLTNSFFPSFLFCLLTLCILVINARGRKVTIGSKELGHPGEIYVVVFDAGSSATRVHVFQFDDINFDLIPIDGQLEIYDMVSPGLSSYAENPDLAGNSIAPLLQKAVNAIPVKLRSQSPLILGATAGLRLIGEEKSEKIIEAVRRLFSNSSLLYEKDRVAVISGTQEGTYMWVAMNYLLGNLGHEFSKTVGIIDLGGASMQMAYAISAEAAASAPTIGEVYINKHYLNGTNYYLYVHSYLRYGQDAARTLILQSTTNSASYCVLRGYNGTYKYNGEVYYARSPPSGSNFKKCRKNVLKALNLKAKCEVQNCTFNGVWNGGGGAGQDKLYLASAFFYRAKNFNIIDGEAEIGTATPADLKKAALATCALKSLEEARTKYPTVWDYLPFVCMDLVYQYTLLTTGFGLNIDKELTIVEKVEYGGFNVEAAWPLGSAIETVSTMSSTKPGSKNMYGFWSHAHTAY